MNMLFKNKYGRKRRKCDINITKATIVPDDIYQKNKEFFVTVQQKNACKLESEDHLWLPFLDQNQPYILVFVIINLQIYNIPVKKWKHGIGPNYINSLN